MTSSYKIYAFAVSEKYIIRCLYDQSLTSHSSTKYIRRYIKSEIISINFYSGMHNRTILQGNLKLDYSSFFCCRWVKRYGIPVPYIRIVCGWVNIFKRKWLSEDDHRYFTWRLCHIVKSPDIFRNLWKLVNSSILNWSMSLNQTSFIIN